MSMLSGFGLSILLYGLNALNVSLHSAFDYNGANEVSTARSPLAWGTVGYGSLTTIPQPSLPVAAPPGTAFSWIGLWTNQSPQTFVTMFPLRSYDQGPFIIDSTDLSMLRAPRHQLRIGSKIVLWGSNIQNNSGAHLFEGVTYTVFNVLADSIQITDASGLLLTFSSGAYGRISTIATDVVPVSGFYNVDVSLLAGF